MSFMYISQWLGIYQFFPPLRSSLQTRQIVAQKAGFFQNNISPVYIVNNNSEVIPTVVVGEHT